MHSPSTSFGSRAWLPVKRQTVQICATALAIGLLIAPMAHAQINPHAGESGTLSRAVVGGLPALGDGYGMSVAAERRLGDSIARQIYKDPDYLDDLVLRDYLNALWAPLLKSAQLSGNVPPELFERLAWELMIDRNKSVNAFALPGGYLGVNLGLVAITERPEELASVLAHELSHVSQRHIARMIDQQGSDTPWLIGALILGAMAAGSNADVANAAIAGSQALAVQNQLNFSREMEREADRVGFGVLTGAGLPGQGFVDMFTKLQQSSRLNDDGAFPYLRSHPLTTERMADMHLRLSGTAAGRAHDPATQSTSASSKAGVELHVLMAARARVLAESVPDRWKAWYQVGRQDKATVAERYAAALSAQQLGLHAQAVALAHRLREGASLATKDTLDLLLIEVLLKAPDGPKDPRLAPLRDAALASGHRAGVVQGALAALATGMPAPANDRLQTWVIDHPRDALAWQTLSRLQAAQGQRVRSLRSEAEAHVAILDNPAALERLKAAQALPADVRENERFDMAIVDARRRDLEQAIRASAREK